MKKYQIIFVLFFSFFLNSENFIDECKQLNSLISNKFSEYNFDKPDIEPLSRIYFNADKSSYGIDRPFKYQRSDSNLVYIDTVSPESAKDHSLKFGDQVYSINDLLVSKMTDEEIDNEIDNSMEKKILKITTINNSQQKIQNNLKYKDENGYFMPVHFDLKSIEKIDSSSSTYKSRFITDIVYTLIGLETISKELIQELNIEDSLTYISQCNYSDKEFDSLNLWKPELINPNVVSVEGDSTKVSYVIVFGKLIDDQGIPNYIAEIYQSTDSIATFKANFNYKSFPFDKQTLIYNFESPTGGKFAIPFFDYNFKYTNNIQLYNWSLKDYQLKSYISDTKFDDTIIGISYQIDIERNYIYFLTKIYLPIIIILLMSFSVLWIKPSSLDSRLQVGVVCFLALITFTFIVDQEIPKLSYLTIMDLVILTSYVFAAITTIESIYIAKYVNDYKKAEKIDSFLKKLLPISYLLIVFLIIFSGISSNPNTIEALKITT